MYNYLYACNICFYFLRYKSFMDKAGNGINDNKIDFILNLAC